MQDTPETPGTGASDSTGANATPPPPAAPTPAPAPAPAAPPGGPTSGRREGLVSRVSNILTRPAAEWGVIDGETATAGSLFVPYAVILAAIPPLAMVLGVFLFAGMFANFILGFIMQTAIAFYILFLAIPFALGLAIDALAPNFGGTKNNVQALKLAVYSQTPLWVGGVLLLLLFGAPIIFWVWLLGGFGYGAYILYLGLPRLMRVQADKAQAFAGAAIGIWFVLLIIARMIAGSMAGPSF